MFQEEEQTVRGHTWCWGGNEDSGKTGKCGEYHFMTRGISKFQSKTVSDIFGRNLVKTAFAGYFRCWAPLTEPMM